MAAPWAFHKSRSILPMWDFTCCNICILGQIKSFYLHQSWMEKHFCIQLYQLLRKSFLLTPWLRPWWKKLFTLPAGYLMNKAVGGSIYIRVISVSKLSRSCFKGVGGGSRRPQNGTTNFSVDCFDDKDLQTFVEVEVGDLIRRTDVRLGSTPQWNAPFNMVLHVGNLHFNLYEPHPNNIKCDYLASYENKTGIISPSKLRMKLIGHRKKDGSNSNSSRTFPSRIDNAEFVNSLLPSNNGNPDDEITSPSLEVPSLKTQYEPKGNGDTGLTKIQHLQKADGGSSSTIHPVRTIEEENLDYDSNASSSSLIFNSPS
nr:uncharacterized protein LOC112741564 isoform X4 [Arachis hypogaea]XP_025646374.1 uncharacterized protein LOC112741564 isoform X4 [Arachis hypogaea]